MDKIGPIDSSHVEQIGDEKLTDRLRGASLVEGAKENVELEQHLSLWQAMKWYPMAIFWAFMVSMCVIMEGYDTILIGNFFAYPTFAKKYGHSVGGGEYQLTVCSLHYHPSLITSWINPF